VEGGPSLVNKKLRKLTGALKRLPLLLHGVWAIPVVLLIRLIRPLKVFRIGSPRVSRIGHFAAEVGQRKARDLVETNSNFIDLYYFDNKASCSNLYWAEVARRWFRIHAWLQHVSFWNRIIPFGKLHQIDLSESGSRDLGGYLEKAQLKLPITKDENELVIQWMAQFGWKIGDPFVCLLVRDAEYLNAQFSDRSWEYHNYRDSDVQTYVKAIDYLTSNEIFVFRMGKKMTNPVNFVNSKFIDYAFRKDQSDMLDVWLFANCNLCITTGSGPDMISDVFRRPILAINFLPLQNLWSWSDAIHYPKILRWQSSQRILTSDEYLTHSYYTTEEYHANGIDIHDLSDLDIYEAVKEAWERVCGAWIQEASNERELTQKFLVTLTNHPNFDQFHGFLHPKVDLAANFLELTSIDIRETNR